jgi:hypothetical protein
MQPIEFLTFLFSVRDCIHLQHLNTKSFAEHKALNEFYDEWLELADTFIETYQGKYGRIEGDVKIETKIGIDSTEYLKGCYDTIESNYKSIVKASDSDLLNIIADMKGLINHTLYLLTLK